MEDLLKEIVKELKKMRKEITALRSDAKSVDIDACTPKEALLILGLNNRGYLFYFSEKIGVLTRVKGGTSYLYSKTECKTLYTKIREGKITIPSTKHLYN